MAALEKRIPGSLMGKPQHDAQEKQVPTYKLGDVVLIQTESMNRGTWPPEIIEETYPGKDNVIRGVHASEDSKRNLGKGPFSCCLLWN
jgi:hypothetical protein